MAHSEQQPYSSRNERRKGGKYHGPVFSKTPKVVWESVGDKPAYILTSARTFFSYNLKMLKRATLVGETTGGVTDVGVFHRIDEHFGIGIREARTVNPYSEPDWAVTGVVPGVKVKAEDALETAEKLAEGKLEEK